ncbi:heterokaryon incompatibility protein-domain-containing protein [Nemania sp. NC0429]|nr:heterokaryon incompatibility protein-domain-containing protein [Nemania sp. NC0429]
MASIIDARARPPCRTCRAIVPNRSQLNYLENSALETLYERDDVYPTFPSVALSAKAGCSLCVLLWRRLTSIPPAALEAIIKANDKLVWVSSEKRTRQLEVSWDRKVKLQASFDFLPYPTISPSGSTRYGRASTAQDRYQHGGAVTSLSLSYRPTAGSLRLVNGTFWSHETVEFTVFDSIDLYSPRLEWRRKMPSAIALSYENVTMIEHWIENCLGNHSECSNARTAENWIPKRLLEINDKDSSFEIRLIEPTENKTWLGIKFAALSHVWGDINTSPPLRLLSSNIRQLKNGIQGSELPKTFLDAVHVCARLGIRFLWIDSLCIIQNSLDDWREQAPLMHRIYGHALITIVATSARSCHDGFLQRNVSLIPTAEVAYSVPAAEEQGGCDDNFLIIYGSDNPLESWRMHAINGSKWNTRAWTMQERTLSSRMVHFCHNKIFFECRGGLQSEENEPVQESDVFNSTLWPRNPLATFEELYQHWQLFVGEYSARNLTVGSDKLLAIQSVAEEMAAVTGEKYIRFAGMWQSNLQHELLWFVSMGKAERLDTWRAPSWSWAAVEGQISLWHRDFRNAQVSTPRTLLNRLSLHPFEVLEIDREYPDSQSSNPGFLKVRTLIEPISHIHKHLASGSGRSFFPYDLVIDEPSDEHGPRIDGKVFAHAKLDFEDCIDVDFSSTTAGMFLYLHVNNNARATGLVLRSQTDVNVSLWKRIGIATLFFDRSERPILKDAFALSNGPKEIALV